MKNLILGLALVSFAVGCKNNDNNQISDPSTAAAPEAACESACQTACDDAAKAECAAAKSECSSTKSECDKGEAKTCPVTGQAIEN